MKAVVWGIVVAEALLLMVGGCSEDGDTTNIFENTEVLVGLTIEQVPGYLLVPDVANPLRCIAYYQGGAQKDWTGRAVWSVSDTSWAVISPSGVLIPRHEGTGEVWARTQDGWIARRDYEVNAVTLLTLSFDPNVLLKDEETVAEATASLSDRTTIIVPPLVPLAWSSSNPGITHQTGTRAFRADHTGQTILAARVSGVTSLPVVLTVDSVIAVACTTVSPAPFLPLDTLRFSATATTLYSGDMSVSTRAEWISSDPVSFLHRGNGLFQCSEPGDYTVRARVTGVESNLMPVEVWNVTGLGLHCTAPRDTLVRGDTVRCFADAEVEGHGTQDLTERVEWVVSNPSVGRFVLPGVFMPRSAGSTSIYCQLGTLVSPAERFVVAYISLFGESFESYPLGTFAGDSCWRVGTADPRARIDISDVAHSGNRSCLIVDSSSAYSTYIVTTDSAFPALRSGHAEFSVRGPAGFMEFYADLTTANYVTLVTVSFTNGYIYSNGQNLGPYSDTQWVTIRIEFEGSSYRYDVYVNGVLRLTGAPYLSYQPRVEAVNFRSGYYPGYCWVDDVDIDSTFQITDGAPLRRETAAEVPILTSQP